MKIICLGNYPPRRCGIATFTENVINALSIASKDHSLHVEVMAMNDGVMYDYPEVVHYTIDDSKADSYIQAANYINLSGAQVLLLQHEYGIFGGASGVLLLQLLRRVKIPIVATFHTVLERPDFHQREVLRTIATLCSKIIIMNGLAIPMLNKIYGVPVEKIVKIEHGVPDFEGLQSVLMPPPESWKNRKVLLTFGLIGRSKGIETVIQALPQIVNKHPEVLYVVLGKTHPHVIRNAGEEYREYLQKLVVDLDIQDHVHFMNQYVSELELMTLLRAADIYITPYHNKAQITSGTLSYAVSSGCAVISTPYWHAEELLADGLGMLFPFGDSNALASCINDCIENPLHMQSMQKRAYLHGQTIKWSQIGAQYFDLCKLAAQDGVLTQKIENKIPEVDFNHLLRLTMKEGLLQHANGILPSFMHGFSLDDNARALIVIVEAFKSNWQDASTEMLYPYLSYLKYMQNEDGSFNNFMCFDHKVIKENFSEDAFGRTVWALGLLMRFAPNDSVMMICHDMFHKALEKIDQLEYARGNANCIFGLYHYIKRFPDQERMINLMISHADQLVNKYEAHQREYWHWFEDALTYDNGLIPAALYKVYELLHVSKYLVVANKTRAFLERICFVEPWLSLVGNTKWLRFDAAYELYAQQPIDATAMIVMYVNAYEATADETMIDKMLQCYRWYLGENDLGIAVYDAATKTCNDGIEMTNINLNKGAESNLAFLYATVLITPYMDE